MSNLIKLYEKWAIQIDVNNICEHKCVYCVKYIRHLRPDQIKQLTVEEFEEAVLSVKNFPGKIGLTGGDPLNHPQFIRLCEIVKEHIPKYKSMIFTSNEKKFLKHKSIIDDTFGEVYLNFHTPEQKNICKHQPNTIAVQDVAPNETVMKLLIENCWCNKMWSPIVGKNGAFFCDCAIGIDNILDLGGGWKIEPDWWKREDYSDQMKKYCKYCGMCVPFPTQSQSDDIEIFSENLYNIFIEKKLRGMNKVKIFKGKLTIEDIKKNLTNWTPWRNREDKEAEGYAYKNY